MCGCCRRRRRRALHVRLHLVPELARDHDAAGPVPLVVREDLVGAAMLADPVQRRLRAARHAERPGPPHAADAADAPLRLRVGRRLRLHVLPVLPVAAAAEPDRDSLAPDVRVRGRRVRVVPGRREADEPVHHRYRRHHLPERRDARAENQGAALDLGPQQGLCQVVCHPLPPGLVGDPRSR